MNYIIHTYGCQMNIHESEKVAGILKKMGYVCGDDEKNADIVVFNTCCIRETAEQKIYGHIGQIKKYKEKNPDMIVVLCGCMVQQEGMTEKISRKFPFIDIVLGTTNLHLLENAVKKAQSDRKKFFDVEFFNEIDESLPQTRTSFPNAWVNIIYGCNNFCTYCIVPYVRSRERSRKIDDILAEIDSLLKAGYKEITLLGQNVNSYGNDLNDGTTFAKLLDEIGKIEQKFRLRFMTSHPKDFNDDLILAISKHKNICNHIHLPVQSGSNAVLSAMNRKYTREHYLGLIEKIRAKIPDVGITTDIMVGFPNETQQDFADTLDLVEKVRYSSAFCFIYSPRKGTQASLMPQIDYPTKQKRITTLLALQNTITKEQSTAMLDKVFEVLVEDTNPKHPDTYCGRTENGRLVNFKSTVDLIGQFVNVKITTAKSATLWGELV